MIHVLDDEQEVHFEEGASETGYKSISFVAPKPAARAEFQLRLPMPAGMMAQPVEPTEARCLFLVPHFTSNILYQFTDIFVHLEWIKPYHMNTIYFIQVPKFSPVTGIHKFPILCHLFETC